MAALSRYRPTGKEKSGQSSVRRRKSLMQVVILMKKYSEIDRVVATAIRGREARDRDYRAQSLKIHPWVCARFGREFTRENLHELTVHHKDHDHDNNPPDGSNWENLCIYCHDNEHARYVNSTLGSETEEALTASVTHKPLRGLAELLKKVAKKQK